MKKRILIILSFFIVLSVVFALTACEDPSALSDGENITSDSGEENRFDRFIWNGYTALAKYVSSKTGEAVYYDAEISIETTKEPTCTEEGVRTYMATHGANTDEKTEKLSALNHDFDSPVWAWDSPDNITATFKCKRDVTHVETAVAKVNISKTEPTCTNGGKNVYTVIVTFMGETFSNKSEETLDALGHDYRFERFEWNDYSAKALYVCSRDVRHAEYHDAAVSSEVTAEPSCTTAGERTYTATFKGNTSVKIEPIEKVRHNFLDGYCTDCGVEYYTEGLNYSLSADGESYTVIGIGTATDTDVIIPSEYENKPVSGIGRLAFENLNEITSVTIPEDVKLVDQLAFKDCAKLSTINYNATDCVFRGGANYVIYNCPNLTTVNFGENVEKIPDFAFSGCHALTNVIIPDKVTSIGKFSFAHCLKLTSITIPDSVKSIDDKAFVGCSSLFNVTLGKGLESIGNEAFFDCTRLVEIVNLSSLEIAKGSVGNGKVGYYAIKVYTEPHEIITTVDENGYLTYSEGELVSLIGYVGDETELVLPEDITEIRANAFFDCPDLLSVVIPENVERIVENAFNQCRNISTVYWNPAEYKPAESNNNELFKYTGIRTIVFGDKVKEIPDKMFQWCGSLKTVVFGSGLKSIGNEAFYGCGGLTEAAIPNGVESIGENAFFDCGGMESLSLGSGLKRIGRFAFERCRNVTSVVIPEGVENIGTGAFSGCEALQSVTIPRSLKIIGYSVFSNCSALQSVVIPDGVEKIEDKAFSGCSSLKSVSVGNGIKKISNGAFDFCNELEYNEYGNAYYLGNEEKPYLVLYKAASYSIRSCEINENTKIVCDYAFGSCQSLTSVTIPNGVLTIGESVFAKCWELTSVTIPDSVTSVGAALFEECRKLTNANVPACVTVIDRMFSGCEKLESVVISDGVTEIGYCAFNYCKALQTIVIPDSVTEIGYDAFRDCVGLTEIVLPDSITVIGMEAFRGCSALKTVVIPDSVESIGALAFTNCVALESVTIPEGVTIIEGGVFSGCAALKNVDIPDSVKTIAQSAFSDCDSLEYAEYGDALYLSSESNPYKILVKAYDLNIKNCRIHEDVEIICDYAFYSCTNITSAVVPEGITEIPSGVFGNCYRMTSVTIPDSVTKIGESAFYGCSALTSVVIPEGVTEIGDNAFNGCSNLVDIVVPNSLTSVGFEVFERCQKLQYTEYENAYYLGNETNPYVLLVSVKDWMTTTSCTINENTKIIGSNAFRACGGITEIVIPDGVVEIGERAFYSCGGITEIVIPESVLRIKEIAFVMCNKLNRVVFENYRGWIVYEWDGFLSSIVSSSLVDLCDPENNATLVKGSYSFERADLTF